MSPLFRSILTIAVISLSVLDQTKAADYTLGTEHPITAPFPQALFLWKPDVYSFRAGEYEAGNATLGYGSATFGFASAAGDISLGVGSASAWGSFSIASGVGSAGPSAAAFGSYTNAWGRASLSAGSGTMASGYYSVALGDSTTAQGAGAVAFGLHTFAAGIAATAIGEQTQANAYGTLAIGRFNEGAYTFVNDGNPNNDGDTLWLAADPIFEVGIGADTNNRKNALTVYKDGKIVMSKRQGDILMGEFGAPGSGD